jgi:hypothetical protein
VQEKECTTCRIVKPYSEFHSSNKNSTGRKSACKECSSKRFQKWRYSNIDRIREWERVKQYKRKYGLSEQQAIELVQDRNRVCEICGETKPIIVDHCHTSGEVRGLICSSCNSVLGYSRDSIRILENSIEYLERFYGKK